MFLTPSDFTGKYELHKGMYDSTRLQSYIDKYEVRYLREMLGVTLYLEFISDLDNQFVPRSPNFLQLYNPFAEDVNMYQMLESDGMLEMLKGFIYFEYSKDLMMQQTTFGGVQQRAENSTVLNTLQSLIYGRYNEAIRTFRAIQDYVLLNTLQPTNQVVEISQLSAGTGYFGGIEDAITMSKSAKIISLTSGGTGYTTGTNVATSGGSGSGLSVNITEIAGIITFASIDVAGIGYSVGDVVTIAGGVGGTLTITEIYPYSVGEGCEVTYTAHQIGGVNDTLMVALGTGYVDAFNVATTGGSGSGCEVNVIEDGSGGVLSITIADEGSGYLVGETLTITSGGGDATFDILTAWNGEINIINITQRGFNFELGDFLGVPKTGGLNGDARYEVTYVGKGHYGDFKGQRKRTAYWI